MVYADLECTLEKKWTWKYPATHTSTTVYIVAQLSAGTFDVSVGQNEVRMRESKLPSVNLAFL
ncbi:hypothetical protein ALC60_01858 [Trachymyrmex zeteki]|uniref:Uncharacterized protein n=1 Tax=Mycetomoellerius zeteki TaxID=64791 RepID=A0A151XFR6_9HYME|nr:hypothetical protein ALC60_01858 [Trachymyrmex zeteki]